MNKLIIFEGLDGAGLSTQSSLLASWFAQQGKNVFLTKEPTTNMIGGIIRSRISGEWSSGDRSLRLLLAADVIHHTEKDILPALNQGKFVVCDRYVLSGLAYGMVNFERDWLNQIHKGYLVPAITFYLKVPAPVCMSRLGRKGFGLELFEQMNFFKQVEKNFDLLSNEFENVVTINADKPVQDVHKEITKILKEKMEC